MAYYTMTIKRAHDPLSGTDMDMWAVMETGPDWPGGRQVAYCSRLDDAERIKALLVYHGDEFPPHEDEHYGRCAMCGDFIVNDSEHGEGICYAADKA